MRRKVFAALLMCAGCVSAPRVEPPEGPDAAAIGVEFRIGKFSGFAPAAVYLVRTEEAVLDATPALYGTSFRSGDRFYLLNAVPGTYRVVGAVYRIDSHTGADGPFARRGRFPDQVFTRYYATVLPYDTSRAFAVTAKPGTLQFAGKFAVLEESDDWAGAHQGEKNIAEAFKPGSTSIEPGFFSSQPVKRALSVDAKGGAPERSTFFAMARRDFEGTDWKKP